MGFTGVARWLNAPATGLQLVCDNLLANHNAMLKGKWLLSIKSYRSTLDVPVERSMCVVTMNDNCFVLLEDPLMPTRGEVLAAANLTDPNSVHLRNHTGHYRSTFITLRPSGSLDPLLNQLNAKWVPVRQSAGGQGPPGAGQQLTIDGFVCSIGTDWLVRCGNVIVAGGAVKGMVVEAEYLPLPCLHANTPDGTTDLLSNLLTSIFPSIPDAKTAAISMSDSQWEYMLSDQEVEDPSVHTKEGSVDDEDDLYVYGDEPLGKQPGDWEGTNRDRRSAYLIVGSLRSEGIIY